MVLTEVKIKPSEEDLSQRQTLWVGGLGPRVTDELLYELFLNAGPLQSVTRPRNKTNGLPNTYAFVKFVDEESVPYAIKLFRDTHLFGQGLHMNTLGTRPQRRHPAQAVSAQSSGFVAQHPGQRIIPSALPPQAPVALYVKFGRQQHRPLQPLQAPSAPSPGFVPQHPQAPQSYGLKDRQYGRDGPLLLPLQAPSVQSPGFAPHLGGQGHPLTARLPQIAVEPSFRFVDDHPHGHHGRLPPFPPPQARAAFQGSRFPDQWQGHPHAMVAQSPGFVGQQQGGQPGFWQNPAFQQQLPALGTFQWFQGVHPGVQQGNPSASPTIVVRRLPSQSDRGQSPPEPRRDQQPRHHRQRSPPPDRQQQRSHEFDRKRPRYERDRSHDRSRKRSR